MTIARKTDAWHWAWRHLAVSMAILLTAATFMSGGQVQAFSTGVVCVSSQSVAVEADQYRVPARDRSETRPGDEGDKPGISNVACDLCGHLPAADFADLAAPNMGFMSRPSAGVPGGEWFLLRPPKSFASIQGCDRRPCFSARPTTEAANLKGINHGKRSTNQTGNHSDNPLAHQVL